MLVTFALICFNQQEFVRDAVRAALAQDYEPLEILIVDNHSTDATFDIIHEEIQGYAGPHSVRVIRQPGNIAWEIFPFAAGAASGEFVVLAHGDDVSYSRRTRCLVQTWRETNASLLSSNAEIIDRSSHLVGFLAPESEARWVPAAELAKGYTTFMHGAALAWHADVFRKFGPLSNARLHAAYDHVLPFRGSLLYGSYYMAQTLLQWRVHGRNAGIQSSDRTGGALVQSETGGAYNIGARICMLDDLDYLIRNEGGKNDLVKLRDSLVVEILTLVRGWSRSRNRLFANGQTPTWIRQAEMEARVGYSKGYFDGVDIRLRWIPKKLRRLTGYILKGLRIIR